MTLRTPQLLAAALAGALALSAVPMHAGLAETQEQAVVHGNNELAIQLYRELLASGDADANVFFSPMSVSTALMLAYEGARGQTEAEFRQVLALPEHFRETELDKPGYHRGWQRIIDRYNQGEIRPYELAVANGLWGEKTMPFRNEFVDALGAHYGAPLETVDFRGDAENQRQAINAWVSDQTRDRINDLLPAGSIDESTRLVLVNAIYFKAAWAEEFSERMTTDQPFNLLPAAGEEAGKTVDVPLMHQRETSFNYADLGAYDALELPYQYGQFSMIVLLPDEADGLADLEGKLSAQQLAEDLGKMQRETVNLWLPKWKMTLDYDLVPSLKAMGLTKAFAPGEADFTGISDSAAGRDLYISAVVHKAFIAVDEEGTEAAAATAIGIVALSAPLPPEKVIDFRVDRPFVYLIRDNQSGAILFMGRVTDPS